MVLRNSQIEADILWIPEYWRKSGPHQSDFGGGGISVIGFLETVSRTIAGMTRTLRRSDRLALLAVLFLCLVRFTQQFGT